MSHADPKKINEYFAAVIMPDIRADGTHLLICGHDWRHSRTRPHVGDCVCMICGRQAYVYDWDFYNALDRIPGTGKRDTLHPAAQVVTA